MQAPSRSVQSTQDTIHPGLRDTIARYRHGSYQRPIQEHNRIVFARLQSIVPASAPAIILDAGCGTGASSLVLAETYPGKLVIGVDKSLHRLRRHDLHHNIHEKNNCLLVRSDLQDFWRLACRAGWQLAEHYLLYPNPWPRPAQLKKRWYAHPVFRYAIALGGRLDMRTNWQVYAEEFLLSLQQLGYRGQVQPFWPATPLSPFEKKYHASAHRLYRCTANLD